MNTDTICQTYMQSFIRGEYFPLDIIKDATTVQEKRHLLQEAHKTSLS